MYVTSSTPNPLGLSELSKGLKRIGLSLSDLQLHQIYNGETVSLENLGLSEIGSVFMLVAAVSTIHLGRGKQPIIFGDLTKTASECDCSAGLPICCWDVEDERKCCLYLTLVDGKPAICICTKASENSEGMMPLNQAA
jgi:hypothetical protein